MSQENLLSTQFYELQTPSLSHNGRKSLKQKCLLSCNSNKKHICPEPIHPLPCNLRDVKEREIETARFLTLNYWLSIFHWCNLKSAKTKGF